MADHRRLSDAVRGQPAGKLVNCAGNESVEWRGSRLAAGKAVHLNEDQAVIAGDPGGDIVEDRGG